MDPNLTPLVDYHVHTARCGHAVGSMEAYVERAIERGVHELGFSDHLYLYWLPAHERDPELSMAEWELEHYVADVTRCRERYAADVAIRLSTEADFIPGQERALERILGQYDWDYIVGSVHFLGAWGFDDSRYSAEFERWDRDELYSHYFDVVGQSAETGLFDVIGHADLVKKFGHFPRDDQHENYARLATRLAQARVCAEVNTAGLRKPCGEAYPHPDLLRAFRESGVPITFGSDAHAPSEVAADFAAATVLMHNAGYDSYVTFTERQRSSHPLAELSVSP